MRTKKGLIHLRYDFRVHGQFKTIKKKDYCKDKGKYYYFEQAVNFISAGWIRQVVLDDLGRPIEDELWVYDGSIIIHLRQEHNTN